MKLDLLNVHNVLAGAPAGGRSAPLRRNRVALGNQTATSVQQLDENGVARLRGSIAALPNQRDRDRLAAVKGVAVQCVADQRADAGKRYVYGSGKIRLGELSWQRLNAIARQCRPIGQLQDGRPDFDVRRDLRLSPVKRDRI